MVEGRFQVLVVTLTALLGRSRPNKLGDSNPVQGSLSMDKSYKIRIFGLGPWSSSMR